jgi:hypothetical protein
VQARLDGYTNECADRRQTPRLAAYSSKLEVALSLVKAADTIWLTQPIAVSHGASVSSPAWMAYHFVE